MGVFRNPPEVNYRAIRDMGLAGWFGSSMMTLAGIVGAGKAIDVPKERQKALDAAMKASTGLNASCIAAYVIGTQLVRENGAIFDGSVPKLLTTGPESAVRAALAGTAIGAAITSRKLRAEISKAYDSKPINEKGYPRGTKGLRDGMAACQALVPALTGWLLFLQLKRDMIGTAAELRR